MDYISDFTQLIVWVLSLCTGAVLGSSTVATTNKPEDSKRTQPADDKKGFPPWLIGVIILSAVAVIILVVTIVQRLLRRRANRRDAYQIGS